MNVVSALGRHRRGAPSLTASLLTVLLFALCVAVVSLATPSQAGAEATGTVVVAKTAGEGQESEPAVAGAAFQLLELPGLRADTEDELQELVEANPRLVYGAPGVPVGCRIQAETDEAGIVRFAGVAPGIYQLRELPTRYGDVERTAATTTLVRVEAGRTVSVRAKNQPLRVDKEVNMASARPGATVAYRITSSVPDVDAAGALHRWEIRDELDQVFSPGSITRIAIANADREFVLEVGVHYADTSADLTLEASLEARGLAELARLRDGHPETTVTVYAEAVLGDDAAPGTRVPNTAVVAVDGLRLDRNAVESNRATFTVADASEPAPSTSPWPTPEETERPGHEAPGRPGDGRPETSTPQVQKTPEPPGRGPRQVLDKLATTGASVLGLVLAGLCAIAIAIVLLRRWREETNETGE